MAKLTKGTANGAMNHIIDILHAVAAPKMMCTHTQMDSVYMEEKVSLFFCIFFSLSLELKIAPFRQRKGKSKV